MKVYSMKLLFQLLSILFLSLSSCSSTNEFNKRSNQKAKDLMSFHLRNINYYVDDDSTTVLISDIKESIELYESISLVKSYREYQIDISIFPLKYNISDWTEFLNMNKDNIYLDKNSLIKFKSTPNYINKNPNLYINSVIYDIEKMLINKHVYVEEIDYLLEIIENVTKIKSDRIDFNGTSVPSFENIKQWKEWLAINSSKLYWNKGTQEVIVKY